MRNGLLENEAHGIMITVIIDAYNYGRYIDAAIMSALSQTLPRDLYEIIVVDDGSTDDTRQRVASYLPEVIYHYQENSGQGAAFNTGMALARGEFVAFLDADDYWAPEKLVRVMDKFNESKDIGVVYHPLRLVDHENTPKGLFPKWFDQVNSHKPVENYKRWLTIIGSATSGIAWRVSALRALLPVPDEFRICADAYLMTGAPLAAKEYGLINEPLGFYRIHGMNNFSVFVDNFESCNAKAPELGAHYNRLCLNNLLILADKFNYAEIPVIKELKVQCFRDDVMAMQKHSGSFEAIRLLCSKGTFSNLEFRLRVYRRATIILQLLISQQLFFKLYRIYSKSYLWRFVQKYIKNSDHAVTFTDVAQGSETL